jgi:hypothetical protein
MTSSAFQLLQRVKALGGSVSFSGDDLQVEAPSPLPPDLMDQLRQEKPAILVALGAPFDTAIASILKELRPNLPVSLRDLSDTKLLVMVNWSIMEAWGRQSGA